jgi:hypothetical protein
VAAVEEERLALVAGHGFDFTEKDGVIAGGVFGDNVACEVRQRAIKERDAGFRPNEADAEEFFNFGGLLALGEMFGEGLLVVAQDADAETPLRFEEREKARVVGDADKDKERLEGNRSEGVGGHAVDLARFALDGDDGDTGGKGSRNAAEERRVESRDRHVGCEFKIA